MWAQALAGVLLGLAGIVLAIPTWVFLLVTAGLAMLRWPLFGVILLAATAPLRWIGAIDIGFHLLPSYVALALAFLALLLRGSPRLRDARTPITVAVGVFFLIAIISAFQSRLIPLDAPVLLSALRNVPWMKSLSRLFLFAGMLALFCYIVAAVRQKAHLKTALTVVIITATLCSAWGIYGVIAHTAGLPSALDGWRPYYTEIYPDHSEPPRLRGPEDEPLFFAIYLMTVLPILLALLFTGSRFVNRKLLWASLPVIGIAFLLTISRSGFLGLIPAVGVLLLAPLGRAPRMALVRSLVASACVVLVCLSLLAQFAPASFDQLVGQHVRISFGENDTKSLSAQVRLYQWGWAVRMFKEHPLLGVGFENYNFHTGLHVYPFVRAYPITFAEPNNLYLKILAETGILGFAAFLVVIALLARSLWAALRSSDDTDLKAVIAGALASFAGIATIYLFTSTIYFMHVWFLLGLAMAAHTIATPHAHRT